jgi:hypothetical protein
MSARLGRLVLMIGTLAACLPMGAEAAAPAWTRVPLAGGRQGLLPRLGLSADLPLALVAGEAIRLIHAPRELDPPLRARAREYFARPDATPDETVPVPLSLKAWRDLLGGRAEERTLLAAILDDRRASLLCYGLLQLDPATLDAIAGDTGLLRRIYERHSGAFAAFAGAVRIEAGRLQLPGGEGAEPAWVALIGEPLAPASRALTALAAVDNGRLLYFADALMGLDSRTVDLAFTNPDPEVTAADQARSVYKAFTAVEPGWKLGDFPFVRLGADPALVMSMLRLAPATGRLRHPRSVWNLVLGDRSLPGDFADRWSELDPEIAEPGWLLERLTDAPLPARVQRLLVYDFVERLSDRLPAATPAEIAWLGRAFRRYPALMLVLERLGVDDVAVHTRLVINAGQVVSVSTDAAQLEINFALFQAPLMLVTRAWQARAIDSATAKTLVASLSRIEPSKTGYGRAVAAWIGTTLLPAVGHDATVEGATAEGSLLDALAGLRAPNGGGGATLTWESNLYRVDVAAPELARLTEVRGLQAGNTLDTALALCRAGAMLAAGKTLGEARDAAKILAALEPNLVPLEISERSSASATPDLQAMGAQASRDIAKLGTQADAKRLDNIATRLSPAEDAALADVLTSLLYAMWLGDPQGQAFLAGNVARRHDYGVRLMTGAEREQTPWDIPLETSGDGEPWHMRGALLGLDIGLGRLALRRTRLDLPESLPTLNESDRRTLVTTLALTNVLDLRPDQAHRVAEWLREGRARLADAASLEPRLDALGLDGRRRQAIGWTIANAPDELPQLFLRTELALLGRPDGEQLPSIWGAADTPRSGCLCLVFPAPPALQRFTGRAGTGLLTSRMTDLKLRVLEDLEDRKLPPALTQGVLASVLQDYLDEVRPVHGDDWWTLARHLDRIPPERFEDYIAGLTAAGPLVPLSGSADAAGNGQP